MSLVLLRNLLHGQTVYFPFSGFSIIVLLTSSLGPLDFGVDFSIVGFTAFSGSPLIFTLPSNVVLG